MFITSIAKQPSHPNWLGKKGSRLASSLVGRATVIYIDPKVLVLIPTLVRVFIFLTFWGGFREGARGPHFSLFFKMIYNCVSGGIVHQLVLF